MASRPTKRSPSLPTRSPTSCCTTPARACARPRSAATWTCCTPRAGCTASTKRTRERGTNRERLAAAFEPFPPRGRRCAFILRQSPSTLLPMTPSIRRKLEVLAERHQEIGLLLSQPEVLADNSRFRALSQEYAQIEPIAASLRQHEQAERELAESRAMLEDAELREMAVDDVTRLEQRLLDLDRELQLLLLPKDPRDEANLYLEVRAGSGGDEAAIFAGDLFRMYLRYAEGRRWHVEVLSEHAGEHGGYKEIVARVEGAGAYSQLKFESGTHCVKRVPVTESQGRVHTSTATVAVLPELDEIDDIPINPADLK